MWITKIKWKSIKDPMHFELYALRQGHLGKNKPRKGYQKTQIYTMKCLHYYRYSKKRLPCEREKREKKKQKQKQEKKKEKVM